MTNQEQPKHWRALARLQALTALAVGAATLVRAVLAVPSSSRQA